MLLWTIIFAFATVTRINSEEPNCVDTEKCTCSSHPTQGKYLYQCPKTLDGIKTTVTVVQPREKCITIICDNHVELDRTILPKASFESIKKLILVKCPLPKSGFRDVLENFNITGLDYLLFRYYQLNNTLSAKYFEGLNGLNTIHFQDSNITKLDKMIFKNHSNLDELAVEQDKITLDRDSFEYTPKLTKLTLSVAGLVEIPTKTLNQLKNLIYLDLWANDLTTLEVGVFDNLEKLQILELSYNKLKILEKGLFRDLKSLIKVGLNANSISEISRDVFEKCEMIGSIRLNENVKIKLNGDVFSNFRHLENVTLTSNQLENLSETLFRGSVSLKLIDLNDNALTNMPENIFEGLTNLKKLILSNNRIDNLQPGVFSSLQRLEVLNLERNNLKTLHEDLFKNLINLKEVKLDHNSITRIPDNFLVSNENLNVFSMSHNEFDFSENTFYTTPFVKMSTINNLRKLDLSYNNVTWYPYDVHTLNRIEELFLQYNKISSVEVNHLISMNQDGMFVNLDNNKITTVFFEDLDRPEIMTWPTTKTQITISNNPIICDCRSLKLIKYFKEQHDVKQYLNINYERLECSGPPDLRGTPIGDVELPDIKCNTIKTCTKNGGCECIYIPSEQTVSVDCSRRNLTAVPELILSQISEEVEGISVYHNQIEVHLEGNTLEIGPGEFDGYDEVTRLYLQGNKIGNITWLPRKLKVLNISDNSFQRMSPSSLEVLNKSQMEHLYLGNNAWKCDCSFLEFIGYLRDNQQQIDVPRCDRNGTKLVELTYIDLCPNTTEFVLILLVTIFLCVAIIACTITLYFTHQKEIKIWLYARGWCQCWVVEEELDMDKTYDAFISFSQKDEEFVLHNILTVLESGEQPYKLCVHLRDWIPGEFIPKQVMDSVTKSRRTVVILSNNFLDSVWGKIEFKTAHAEAMLEGRSRVIIVIYGDVDLDKLDEDFKAYIKTNTYIKWGDPWFWEKMRYALPRRYHQYRDNAKSKKLANMMQVLDDKFRESTKGAKNYFQTDTTSTSSNSSGSEESSLTRTTIA